MFSLTSDKELGKPGNLERELRSAGFESIAISAETCDQTFKDKEDWWAWIMRSADSELFANQTAEIVEAFKVDAFRKLEEMKTSEGLRARYQPILTKGRIA